MPIEIIIFFSFLILCVIAWNLLVDLHSNIFIRKVQGVLREHSCEFINMKGPKVFDRGPFLMFDSLFVNKSTRKYIYLVSFKHRDKEYRQHCKCVYKKRFTSEDEFIIVFQPRLSELLR